MALRDYSGTAKATQLAGDISAATTTLNVVDGTGYPTGSAGPFIITLDAGLTNEEKVLVASRVSNTLTVAPSGRGYDGTTASDHKNTASVQHTFSALDAREANDHVNNVATDPHPQYLTQLEGAGLFAASGHSHVAGVKTVYQTLPFRWQGLISNEAGNEYNIMPQQVVGLGGQKVTLIAARHMIRTGGPVVVRLLRNGQPIPGWGTLDANTTVNSPIQVTPVLQTFSGPVTPLLDGNLLTLKTSFVSPNSYDLLFDLIVAVEI